MLKRRIKAYIENLVTLPCCTRMQVVIRENNYHKACLARLFQFITIVNCLFNEVTEETLKENPLTQLANL